MRALAPVYAQNSVLIAGLLLLSLVAANELGYRAGQRRRASENEPRRAQVNTIQAALLGILGLLLGFTFSLSLQRYDSRSIALVDEANAIETAYLRADLLPAGFRSETRGMLRNYLDLRVRAAAIALDDRDEWDALIVTSRRSLDEIWTCAREAVSADERPVVSVLYAESLNALIDAFGRRNAALDRHVPELVLYLLFGTFLLTGSLVGYTSGIVGRRAVFASYVLITLIVLMVFLIIDLDRPRRGLIVVSQASLIDLQAAIRAAPHHEAPLEDRSDDGAAARACAR